MELKQMRYFITVVQEKGVCAAAKCLTISQPSVTYQIKLLEEELGTPLFLRLPKGIRLTQAGMLFYQKAQQIIAMADMAGQQIRDLGKELYGTLHFGTSHSGLYLIHKAMDKFYRQHPLVQYNLLEGSISEMTALIEKGEIEFALGVLRDNYLMSEQIEWISMPPVHMLVCAHAHHLPYDGDTITLPKLATVPLIASRSSQPYLIRAFARYGLTPRFVSTTAESRTTLMQVHMGIGAAILPSTALYEESERSIQRKLRIFKLDDMEMCTQIIVFWHRKRYLSRTASAFLDAIMHQSISCLHGGDALFSKKER